MRGKVKLWNAERGFGFIACDGSDDVFCHISEVEGGHEALGRGTQVEFEITPGRDGRSMATKVRVISK
jgi:cold shock protein